MLNPALRLKTTRYALVFAFALGLVLCALPLTGALGPESALVLALGLSPWTAALGARAMHAGQGRATSAVLREAVLASAAVLAVPIVVIALNAFRVRACDPWGNLGFIALGPGLGVALAAVVGGFCAALIRRPALATLAALAIVWGEVTRALVGFVKTPAIFAFGHFFGYFPGTFYDREVTVPDAWLIQRGVSALIAGGLWAYAVAIREPESGLPSLERLRSSPRLACVSLVAAVLALSTCLHSHRHHFSTSARLIAHELGLIIEAPRCRVIVPRELDIHLAHRLAEDCELRVSQLERRLGVREDETITAYFFRSSGEKRALMGAANVYIAKPWRREVYLQLSSFPHPVLPHELAHAVARHAASGPFGVPGKFFGLVPEPVLIEGTAVALEPLARGELTVDQWARAAHEAGVAPPLSSLLGPGFFGSNQALAYTLAGSFLRFVLDTYGPEGLRAVYRSGDVERSLGRDFASLERDWKAALQQIPLSAHAADLARLRFERPSVLAQVCPHEVAALGSELSAALAAGDLDRAGGKCREILEIDPNDTSTRATLASTLARQGDFAGALQIVDALSAPPRAPSPTLTYVRTQIADARYAQGDFAAAAQAYRELLEAPQGEDQLRQLEVKLLGLSAGDPTRQLIRELMVGDNRDSRVAMHLIHGLYAAEVGALAPYLEARQLLQADRPDLALPLLRQALETGLPGELLRLEALRIACSAAFVLGALDEAEAFAQNLLEDSAASLADRALAQDYLERIAFRRNAEA